MADSKTKAAMACCVRGRERLALHAGWHAVLHAALHRAALAAALSCAPIAAADEAPWINPFVGGAVAPHSSYGEAGVALALGADLDSDGWLARLKLGTGTYDYKRAPGDEQSVDFASADLMLGYQLFLGDTRISAYLGGNVEDHDNEDRLADVRGSKTGGKLQVELYAPLSEQIYVLALTSYASTFETYYAMAKVGFALSSDFDVGPELQVLGNERYDAMRTGVFASFDLGDAAQLVLSGGYSNDDSDGDLSDADGGYFTLHLRANY